MIGDQLQKAIHAALTGAGIAGGRIYDGVPYRAQHPYVTIGDEQIADDGTTCEDAWRAFVDIHVWSRPNNRSKVELKNLMAEIVPVLATELTIADHRTIAGELQTTRAFRDPDGLTEHGVITLRYLIDNA